MKRYHRRAALLFAAASFWTLGPPDSWSMPSGIPGATGVPTSVPTTNTLDRAAVLRLYRVFYRASDGVPSGFSGDVREGRAGTVSQAYQDATLRRINYFRVMAGLPGDVVFDRTLSGQAQKAALMMAANNAVNHFPPPDWRFYTAEGAAAASHAVLTRGSAGPDAVNDCLEEPGSRNGFVGHRRWLLYPPQATMGAGSVDAGPGAEGRFADGISYATRACAVWTVAAFKRRPPVPEPFVAWPPPGYVPRPLVFARWSISYPAADFSSTTVRVLKNGAPVSVSLETPKADAAGDNTLVWTLPGNVASTVADETYRVTVSRVRIDHAPHQFVYRVTSCNPERDRPPIAGR